MLAVDNASAIGGLVLAAAALITALVGVWRSRHDSDRGDLETIIDSFKTLVDAERETTDRQVRFANSRIQTLEDEVVELRRLHEDCETERRQLVARLGLG